jgi:L-asparaginase
MASDGLAPELSANQLLQYVPQVKDFCRPVCKQIFSIDSTNMAPSRWLQIAACIRENYDEYDGFVITHGTDTMAYTAAALSYLIQRSPKPIILTGAQKPIGSDNTDSKINLEDAFRCACSNLCGVLLVFNGKVMLGTRARKTHTKSFRAFSSINYPELAYIRDGRVLPFIVPESRERPTFYDRMDEKVALLKMIPGTDSALLAWMLEHNDALIIESFGVGGMPSYRGTEFHDLMAAGMKQGKTIVMTTQVENEGSDLAVYSVGNSLKTQLGVLEAYDMTTEAVVGKLMWILGQTRDPDEIRRLFYRPGAADILLPASEA